MVLNRPDGCHLSEESGPGLLPYGQNQMGIPDDLLKWNKDNDFIMLSRYN